MRYGQFPLNTYHPVADLNAEVGDKKVTKSDLDQLERYADKIFAKVGIDVEFTRHFLDRVNDPRNKKPINMPELTRLFKQSYKKYGKKIAKLGPDAEAVINDMKSDINMPFVLNLKGGELELVAKTIMRKKDFKTSNPKLAFEQYRKLNEKPRIPRKKGQPAKSDKHSDLYTDEDPKGTIHGLKFASVEDAKASVKKIESSDRSHAHKIQAAIAMEQRAKVMGKTGPADVYRAYIERMKKKTKQKSEGLWDNIRKKKERIKRGSGEKMRKRGEKGAPTSDQIKRAQSEDNHTAVAKTKIDHKREREQNKIRRDGELDRARSQDTARKNIQTEKAPNTADAMKRYKSGKAGFTDIAHLKAKGLIPRSDGTKKKSDKYK